METTASTSPLGNGRLGLDNPARSDRSRSRSHSRSAPTSGAQPQTGWEDLRRPASLTSASREGWRRPAPRATGSAGGHLLKRKLSIAHADLDRVPVADL